MRIIRLLYSIFMINGTILECKEMHFSACKQSKIGQQIGFDPQAIIGRH